MQDPTACHVTVLTPERYGYNEVDVIRRLTSQGVAGFLQKPYASASLTGKVKPILEQNTERHGDVITKTPPLNCNTPGAPTHTSNREFACMEQICPWQKSMPIHLARGLLLFGLGNKQVSLGYRERDA